MKTPPVRVLEILESRIAPALFFVSGVDLTIHDASGNSIAGDTAAATAAGAAKALLLHKGDSLIFDANNNHKIDPGDYAMFVDTAGESMVFLTDLNGDGKFEPGDFSGVAVGDGFKGTMNGILHGSVATLLDNSGAFSATTIQPSSVAGLTLNGYIAGSVLAGKNITGITAKLPAGGDPLALTISGSIFSGNSFNGNSISFDGGATNLSPTYTPGTGEAGGNISKITLPGGMSGIFAGNAGAGAAGPGAQGGSISGVTVGGVAHASLVAGAGSDVTSGVGGAGGDIIGVKVETRFHTVTVIGGEGGSSANGAGGDGGEISGLTLAALVNGSGGAVTGGQGGAGGGTGMGGVGGAIENSAFNIAALKANFTISGGLGGDGGTGVATGGAGGALSNLAIIAHGSAASGMSYASTSLTITGGTGGIAGGGGAGSTGGIGGAVSGLKLNTDGVFGGDLRVNGGSGGSGGTGVGNGGNGGNLSNVNALLGSALEGVEFDAYNSGAVGGSGGTAGGNGGKGGSVAHIAAANLGYIDDFDVYAGEGGAAQGASGNAGDAGSTANVVLTNRGGVRGIGIYSEDGANCDATAGNGGNAGSLHNATINNFAFVGTDGMFLGGYYGGNAGTTGNGGKGGDASNLRLNDPYGSTAGIYIYAGSGGNGAGVGGKGGNAGTLSKVFVDAPLAHCSIGYNNGTTGKAGTGAGSMGADGGLITGISGTVHTLDVFAYPGGNATDGTGGNGGNINGIKFNVSLMANIIIAGDGGNATTGTPGTGGSIQNVFINGDIGDFTQSFNTTIDYNGDGMGGLVAGRGGALNGVFDDSRNGSISNVTAHRIAAIVAGQVAANALVAGDAVLSITNLKATEIGADLNGNGVWDYAENNGTPGYQFSTGSGNDDALIDGLVLVKTGGFVAPPVTPLKLIEV